MNDTDAANPYAPSTLDDDQSPRGMTRLQTTLLTLLAVALLLRGGFMLLMLNLGFARSGVRLDTHFRAAVLTKDSVYAITALVGGLLLLRRHKLGWWFATCHWCWYVAGEILVVSAAATLGWAIPVHHDPPALYRVLGMVAMFAIGGFTILLWRPIAVACQAPSSNRFLAVSTLMLLSTIAAFMVNWWMYQR